MLRDTLIRLDIVEETPPEAELTEEAMAARITAMCGVESWESPHAGVSVLNVTLPSDEAHEIKQRLAAGAKKLNLREDEIITRGPTRPLLRPPSQTPPPKRHETHAFKVVARRAETGLGHAKALTPISCESAVRGC